MRISLAHKLFNDDPYRAFASQHEVTPKLWHEMYNKRYLWHGYDIPILSEYFNLVTKKELNERTIRRWIKRTELYNHAQQAIRKGVREVSPSYFDKFVTDKELADMLK